MQAIEVVLGLLAAVVILATLAHRLNIPYPVLLVLGGLALSFVPGLPEVQLDPDTIFLLFVPPLVYSAAVSTPWRDFRTNLRPILLLAVGLVLLTIVVVAGVAHYFIPNFSWPVAFVLATIVAPTDAVAVTAVTERLSIPRRLITILEGESLVNDASSLVSYRLAVTAVVTGIFIPHHVGFSIVWMSVGGVAFGLGVGWLLVHIRRRLRHSPIEITISLLTPYAAFMPAEGLRVSGVLAVVAAGIYTGRQGLDEFGPETRVHGTAFWSILDFLLNGLAFILIGLEMREVRSHLARMSAFSLIGYIALITALVIVVRTLWVFSSTYINFLLSRREDKPASPFPWQQSTFVAWAGVRGIDSLVIALALPEQTNQGTPFPERSLIILLSFGVILFTVVVQGLTLASLAHWLGLRGGKKEKQEEAKARIAATQAGLKRLDQLAKQENAPQETIESLRSLFQRRLHRFEARLEKRKERHHEEYAAAAHHVLREVLQTQREAITELRDREVIGDDVYRKVVEDLDFEELRLE